MIWLIGAAVITFIVAVTESYNTVGDAIFLAFMGAFVGAFIALIAGVIWNPGVRTVEKSPVALQSLADGGTQVHGRFFLGSGIVNSKSVYTWYESTSENSYVQRQVPVDHAVIHYMGESEQPHYVVRTTINNAKPGLDAFRILLNEAADYYDSYDFYVPKGTIKNNYTLDSE